MTFIWLCYCVFCNGYSKNLDHIVPPAVPRIGGLSLRAQRGCRSAVDDVDGCVCSVCVPYRSMSASRRSSRPIRPSPSSRAVPALDRTAAARIAALLSPVSGKRRSTVQIVGVKGQRLELPAGLTEVMHRAAELLAEGRAVAVLPEEEMLTTQEAASVLNVSRQYLVRLVDTGELPAEKVGSHRRLRAADVAAYKSRRDAKRRAALSRLVELSESVGGYAIGVKPR
jgi:excisionase family DNA binding protein